MLCTLMLLQKKRFELYTNLTKENIKLYARNVYSNPGGVSFIEFEEDYLRIKYLKTLLNKYVSNKTINIHILVNHIICIQNVFPGEATAKILFIELDEPVWNSLATILSFLSIMPENMVGMNGRTIYLSDLTIDNDLLQSINQI